MAQAHRQLLSFRVADKRFVLPASSVREVVRRGEMTRVPLAPNTLAGLSNLRGKVIPVVALGALVDAEVTRAGRIIVLERPDSVGLLVDEVSAVVARTARGTRLIDIDTLLAQALVASEAPKRGAGVGGITNAPREVTREAETTLVAFKIGAQEYAFPVTEVEEILPLPEKIAALPLSDAVALGSVAWRGGLLPLLSLRILLDLDDDAQPTRQRVLVVRIGGHRVGLTVDSINAILSVPESMVDPVPAVLSRGRAEARIQGICRLENGSRLMSVLSAEHLLRSDLAAKLLQEPNVEEVKMEDHSDSEASEQFLIFKIGGQEFGMPLGAVREVTRLPPKLTRLPKAPTFVEGMINLRGKAIPVIDQARRFDDQPIENKQRRVIVARLGEVDAGFLVDSVSDVLRIPTSALSKAPDLGDERLRLFDRVANLDADDRVILIVEPQELLDGAERDLIAAMTGKDRAATS